MRPRTPGTASLVARLLLVLSLAVPALSASPAAAAVPGPGSSPHAAGILVRFRDDLPATAAAAGAVKGLRIASVLEPGSGVAVLPLADGTSAEEQARLLGARGDVLWAEPDYPLEPASLASPTDPDYLDSRTYTSGGGTYIFAPSWWVRRIGGPASWARGYGTATPLRGPAESFRVAVIDSGCWLAHPDIGDNVLPGYDLFQTYRGSTGAYTTDSDVTPVTPGVGGSTNNVSSHGTAVAAIVAGTVNGVGMVGVGGDVQVVPYKVHGIWLDAGDYGYEDGQAIMLTSAVVAAIYRAVDDGCRVINMSLGGYTPSSALQAAVDHARSNGVLVVAAMGNDDTTSPHYPAACTGVIGVTATGLDTDGVEIIASYSNSGAAADIAAPGNMHWLPITPGYDADGSGSISRPGYTFWQGTSMASPVVAGTAAFLWRAQPSLTLAQMETLLRATSVDLGAAGRDDLFGSGRVDVAAGYARLVQDYPPLPATASLTLPAYSPSSSVAASWAAVSGCTGYETSLDSGTPAATTALSRSLSPLADGPHSVAVRPTSATRWPGAWVSKTVTVDTAVPSVTKPTMAGTTLAWTGNGTGSPCTYEVSIDAATVASALPSPSWPVSGVVAGSTHQYGVRATDAAGNRSPWATATLTLGTGLVQADRVSGSNRYATSAAISRSAFAAGGCTDAVLVTGENFPDALSAGPLASALHGPLLLTRSGVLSPEAMTELKRLGVRNVTIVGGTSAVSAAVESSLRTAGMGTSRLAGKNRYDTSAMVATRLAAVTGRTGVRAFLASGANYPDALAASAPAAASGSPILLTAPTSLPKEVRSVLSAGRYSTVVVVGGPSAVSAAVLSSVPLTAARISGGNRYETAAAIASYALANGLSSRGTVGLASGTSFPDALAAGPVVALGRGVLYLTDPASLSQPARAGIAAQASASPRELAVYGGTAAVSDGTWSAARTAFAAQ